MKKLLILISAMAALLPSPAKAQATRTWVSGVGDDANPCSRTAPGKTFAGAISKTAAGGVIDVLDAGGFGAVTITKSVTIEGDAAEGDILVSGTSGIIINAATNDVVILRNLTFEGLGTSLAGIQILSAGAVHIENCRINGFTTTSGINYINTATNAQLFIKDTTIHNCAPAGINLAPAALSTVLIEKVSITGCGHGIDVAANTKAVVVDTTASGNAGAGFLVGTNAQLILTRVTSADNQIGIQSSGTTILSDSVIVNNAADGLKFIKPGTIRTYHNNRVFGNTPDGRGNFTLFSR